MEYLELIIIVSNQFVACRVAHSDVKATNEELKRASDNKSWFCRDNVVFARGDAISGWYYREIQQTSVDALNRMTDVLKKQVNDGDDWKG